MSRHLQLSESELNKWRRGSNAGCAIPRNRRMIGLIGGLFLRFVFYALLKLGFRDALWTLLIVGIAAAVVWPIAVAAVIALAVYALVG